MSLAPYDWFYTTVEAAESNAHAAKRIRVYAEGNSEDSAGTLPDNIMLYQLDY